MKLAHADVRVRLVQVSRDFGQHAAITAGLEHARGNWRRGRTGRRFSRGDKYSWVDLGSSYAPSDINVAFLLAQLERAEEITSPGLRLRALGAIPRGA